MFFNSGPSERISYARLKMSSLECPDPYKAHFRVKNSEIDPICTDLWDVNFELSRTCRGTIFPFTTTLGQ
jgi:hypothetical protein